MRTRVTARSHDERNEYAKDNRRFDGVGIVIHDARRKDGAAKKGYQPNDAFFIHFAIGRLEIVVIECGHTAHFLEVFGGLVVDDVDDVVDRNDPFHDVIGVDDGEREMVFTCEDESDRFLVHIVGDFGRIGFHDIGNLFIARGFDEVFERDDAQEVLLMVEDVDVIDRFEFVADLPANV